MLIFLLIILYIPRCRMKARHQKGYIRTSQKPKKETRLKTNEWIPAARERETEDQRLWKAFELITACWNQATNDECQNFGKMIPAELRNYNGTKRFAIQNEIISILLNAKRGFMNVIIILISSQLNHPNPTSQVVQCKMYPQSINPPPQNSPSSFHSQNPLRISTITCFCLRVFPQQVIRQLRPLQRKIFIYKHF